MLANTVGTSVPNIASPTAWPPFALFTSTFELTTWLTRRSASNGTLVKPRKFSEIKL